MAKNVQVLVLRTAGTNCNEETAYAFSLFGAKATQVHVKALASGEVKLNNFHILALPGGFSYGDDIASGRILANELRLRLGDDIAAFIGAGKLIIGICNGFQILVKAGILPGLNMADGQEATLFHNDSAKFESRWTHLSVKPTKCIWTKNMPSQIYLPVAHGEGKFIPKNDKIFNALKNNGQVVLNYCSATGAKPVYPDNPNGSIEDIAGICDPSGRVLGLMPHPERHLLFEHHPSWTRLHQGLAGQARLGQGAMIFENGVNYAKKHLI